MWVESEVHIERRLQNADHATYCGNNAFPPRVTSTFFQAHSDFLHPANEYDTSSEPFPKALPIAISKAFAHQDTTPSA